MESYKYEVNEESMNMICGCVSNTRTRRVTSGKGIFFSNAKKPPERSCDWRNLSAAKRAAREGKLEVASTKRWSQKCPSIFSKVLRKRVREIILLWSKPYGKRTWLENDSPVPTQNTSSNGGSSIRMLLGLYMQFRGQCSTPKQLRSLCSTHCSSLLWKRAIPNAHVFLETMISQLWARI